MSFPARPFVVHGERRNFALLRAVHNPAAQQPLRYLVLEEYEAEAATADDMAAHEKLLSGPSLRAARSS